MWYCYAMKENGWYIVAGFAVAASLLGYFFTKPKPLTREECYRLGSNERMNACLAEFAPEPSPSPETETVNGTLLSINSTQASRDGIIIVVKNGYSFTVSDPGFEVEFMQNGTKVCGANVLDTETILVDEIMFPGDTKTFVLEPESIYYPQGYTYCVSPLGATIE